MTTQDRAVLRLELVRDEGIRLRPYTDAVGKLSIGCGRNLTDVGITTAEVEVLLEHDIDVAIAELDRTQPWWTRLDGVRQRVLVNMAFNMGMPRLLGFRRMWQALEQDEYETAADEMEESVWAIQVGARAERLASMMRSGAV